MTRIAIFSILAISVTLISCGNDSPQLDSDLTLEQQVNILIEQDEYEDALDLLADEDETDPVIAELLEKTHLNYGLHSMNTFDADEMRTRMNNALMQFAEVLRINPQNAVAREQIDQIMGVYATMPDRGPDDEALEALRDVGYEY
ncbi:hypothetical protein DYD21_02935 [Rhodohalobacter sp. SW132]|uniref:hypothetical protein n=1 Tax=Rhodohalobacter sp. SW132 TaxID=2293433 RepID=UPI000E2495A3|nr:hypothetical protein [Rhodohalobacter sp. SW132]REL38925.1 hypothetical protein DYD21_02935 [Rhodohalobacter sp. SW132]